jgi:hypothetical protein
MTKFIIDTRIRTIFKKHIVDFHVKGEVDVISDDEPNDEPDDFFDEPGEYDDPEGPDDEPNKPCWPPINHN